MWVGLVPTPTPRTRPAEWWEFACRIPWWLSVAGLELDADGAHRLVTPQGRATPAALNLTERDAIELLTVSDRRTRRWHTATRCGNTVTTKAYRTRQRRVSTRWQLEGCDTYRRAEPAAALRLSGGKSPGESCGDCRS